MNSSRTFLVTGSTGFIGTHVCAEMRTRKLALRRVVRRPEASHEAITISDIGPHTDWSAALDGVSCVIHLAGHAHAYGRGSEHRDRMMRVNSEGTAALVRAAARAGVERIVFLSTIKVNGEVSGWSGFRESDEPDPMDDYARSKAAAEEHVRGAGLPWTNIRTPLVYGAGVKANFLALMRAVDRGLPLPLGRIDFNRRSLIAVENLADAILSAATNDAARSQTFLVADDEAVSPRELALRIGVALRRPARLLPVPVFVLRMAGLLAGKSASVDRLTETLVADTTKIRQCIGWRPILSLDEGLRNTTDWYLRARRSR